MIRLTRNPTLPPTTSPPNLPAENLHNAINPQSMTRLIVPRTWIQHSSRNALALKPGVVETFLNLKADSLGDVDFDLDAPVHIPGAEVLRGVEGARGAGAAAGTIISHRVPVLGLIFVRDMILSRVRATTLFQGLFDWEVQDRLNPDSASPAFDSTGVGALVFGLHIIPDPSG